MNINTPFKCYWKGDSGTVYTVSDKTDMYFSCTWFDDFGREEFVDYSKSSLLKQIKNGGVIVVGSEQQDPLVTIPQSEYDNLIDEINMLQELVAELSKTNVNLATDYPEQFKPISEYTLADWELAREEDWVFECHNGSKVRIMETYTNGGYVLRGDDCLTRTIDGHWCAGETDGDDIVKRIK